MTSCATPAPAAARFIEGDEVVLAKGTYTGTPGVFLRYRPDIKWADIRQCNGAVWSHPVEWLTQAEASQNPRSRT